MKCPSCQSPLETSARFCGVCGHRLAAGQAGPTPAPIRAVAAPTPAAAPAGTKTPVSATPKAAKFKSDDVYVGQTLNGRFKVESKIGEGGFGAVYRGVQVLTGRKVALKLLHPEMTKDDNLVARFKREGMVLCNLRDAHTITTYDFDQTPDGTLYIAMELLEGKSLHQAFHEQSPIEWRRMFRILIAMCSSLAEAHAQGIVHRDLKPENVYLENRSGNPDFVKILDFGIAKVMRGDGLDPGAAQLTATGQTLGTLEYMSPEQLMGKALDGRSDIYALGVVAYEMITGRLPFPDAKGPAGLITAQLKQTPKPPSQVNPSVGLPSIADRVILRCLEKDKNNRYADTTAFAAAMTEVLAQVAQGAQVAQAGEPVARPRPVDPPEPSWAAATAPPAAPSTPAAGAARAGGVARSPAGLASGFGADPGHAGGAALPLRPAAPTPPPPLAHGPGGAPLAPPPGVVVGGSTLPGTGAGAASGGYHGGAPSSVPGPVAPAYHGAPDAVAPSQAVGSMAPAPYAAAPYAAAPYAPGPPGPYAAPRPSSPPAATAEASGRATWVLWLVGLLVAGVAVGTGLALLAR